MALATRRTAKGGRKHILTTREMSLRTPIMRNTTADVMVAHNTGTKPGMMRVETKVTEIETGITMKKESMTPTLEIPITKAGAP